MAFTIGADPELFLTDGKNLISAIDKIGGSKYEPLGIGEGCAIQEDNVAAEFCIPPCTGVKEFIDSIDYARKYIAAIAKDHNLILATAVSAGSFQKKELIHPRAMEFGCDPDYNAWTKHENPKPHAKDPTLRSAGGHVHIGTKKDPYEVIKAMDLFLGVPSISMDADTKRRELYGKAGSCRIKEYGAEYRTLSNFWIWNKESIRWVYLQTKKAEKFAETYDFTREDQDMITSAINDSNHNLVVELERKFPQVYK